MNLPAREKVLFIVNPTSGKMTLKNDFFRIIRVFSDAGYEPTVLMTTKPGDAVKIARNYGPKFNKVISCGGDGTLNEVVSGLMCISEAERPCVGFIPAGTTNDLAETLKMPKNPIEAAVAIIKGTPAPNDVGIFNSTRYFNYIASCGAFTSTSYATPQNMKNSLGHMAYVFEGIKSLGEIKPMHIKVESEEMNFEDDFVFMAVTNALSVAGIYKFDPKLVNLNDGLFEVTLIKMPKNTAEVVDVLFQLGDLTNTKNSSVVFFRTNKVTFTSDDPISWTVDGEFGGKLNKIAIQNKKSAINIIRAPSQMPEIKTTEPAEQETNE